MEAKSVMATILSSGRVSMPPGLMFATTGWEAMVLLKWEKRDWTASVVVAGHESLTLGDGLAFAPLVPSGVGDAERAGGTV